MTTFMNAHRSQVRPLFVIFMDVDEADDMILPYETLHRDDGVNDFSPRQLSLESSIRVN